jgi:molecular chaperone GrpE
MSPSSEGSGGSRSPQRPGAGDGLGSEEQQAPAETADEIQIPWARGRARDDEVDEAVLKDSGGAEAPGDDAPEALATVQRERDEYLEMLRRVQADFENYKKRMLRQQTEHLERAAQAIVTKLLPALDAFDLAREHLSDSEELSDEGKALVQASALLFDTLAKEGLERVDDSGKPFDPTVHEAVEHLSADPGQPAAEDSDAQGPVVVSVLRPGYRWKGRVIRPAMVRVRG